MRRFPAVVLEELLIDRFSASKALIFAMPEADLVFSQLPAEAHVAVAVAGHEVQQADIQVLHHGSGFLKSSRPV
jgi:hypothetical protein